ncbi:MAG: hypothetical protein GY714_09880, partial [Desulfobacterales bacterium]|nr:hypothetical protein [Desulfobacterales bacterium]
MYTDGACPNNNSTDISTRSAGIGVWFATGDPRNLSEPVPLALEAPAFTNNRAEAFAAIRALQSVPPEVPLEVRTDSKWLIGGVTGANARNENLDLWAMLDEQLDLRPDAVCFRHVSAHVGILGNEGANSLAVAGATLCRSQGPGTRPLLAVASRPGAPAASSFSSLSLSSSSSFSAS